MFLQELASRIQSAIARGLTPDMEEYRPLQRGEEVIGTVTNPELLALIAILDDKQADFLLRYPSAPTDAVRMRAAIASQMEIDTLIDMMRFEIRRRFMMAPDDLVVLRQGYGGPVVVKPKADDAPPNGITVAAIAAAQDARAELQATVGLPTDPLELLEMLSEALPDCGNPTCPIHGVEAQLGFANQSFLRGLGR